MQHKQSLPRRVVSSCEDPTCLWSRRRSWHSKVWLVMTSTVRRSWYILANLACWRIPKEWHLWARPRSTSVATLLGPQQHDHDHCCRRRRWFLGCFGSNVSTEVWSYLVLQHPIRWIGCSCIRQSRRWNLITIRMSLHGDLPWCLYLDSPMVGIVVTISPSFSL